jgi:predicted amidophosphoribosyltransferase
MAAWADPLREALADALALVLPVACAGCGAPDRAVCRSCRAALAGPVLRRSLDGARLEVVSGAAYEGVAARIVTAVKDAGATEAAAALAAPLRRAVAAALEQEIGARAAEAPALRAWSAPPAFRPVLLVAAPSAARSTRRRGYVPIELVARAARLPVSRSLRSTRPVRDQAALTAAERARNVGDSMTAHPRLAGRTVLLLDDVVTTGSTLAEAARAVRAAGGTVRGAATITATPAHAARPPPASPRLPTGGGCPPLLQELNR